LNKKFDTFVENLKDLYTAESAEVSGENYFKKMMEDFVEYRNE
jgi:hypothetical protein